MFSENNINFQLNPHSAARHEYHGQPMNDFLEFTFIWKLIFQAGNLVIHFLYREKDLFPSKFRGNTIVVTVVFLFYLNKSEFRRDYSVKFARYIGKPLFRE